MSSKKKQFERRAFARAWYTAGRMFDWRCPQCGANSVDMAEKCSADLSSLCPGFERTEECYQEFEKNYRKMTGNDHA
jgi:hypothetical protein